VSQQWWSMVF